MLNFCNAQCKALCGGGSRFKTVPEKVVLQISTGLVGYPEPESFFMQFFCGVKG